MTTWTVTARQSVYFETEIEADTYEEAARIANEMESWEFRELQEIYWKIEDIESEGK